MNATAEEVYFIAWNSRFSVHRSSLPYPTIFSRITPKIRTFDNNLRVILAIVPQSVSHILFETSSCLGYSCLSVSSTFCTLSWQIATPMLTLLTPGIGTGRRLEWDARPVINRLREATNEYAPRPFPPSPTSCRCIPPLRI